MMDIPQEQNSTLDGQKKVMYAKDKNGKFETFNYASQIEEFATKTAINEFETLANESLNNSSSSPIEFYMNKNRMDLATLSSIVDMFQFRVKRHLKMSVFIKMNDKLLERYASVFEISLKELKNEV